MPTIEINTIKPAHNRVYDKMQNRAYNKAHNGAYNDSNSHDGICIWQNSHTIEFAYNKISTLESTQ